MDNEKRHSRFTIPLELSSAEIVKSLKRFLTKDLANPQNCPRCGGLTPELSFDYNGKEYFFTCTKIVAGKNGTKVLAETDYKKFGKYCAGV